MKGQLPLPLPYSPAFGRADFLISDCNEAAFGWIERWPQWPGRALVMHGPADSGKTHLARLWAERSHAVVASGKTVPDQPPDALAAYRAVAVDDAPDAPDEALLHLYNCCAEAGAWLLIVSRLDPAEWPFELPDLASRLRAAPSVAIGTPDDHLLAAVIVKHFTDRQIPIKPAIVAFLLRRMERSFAAAATLAQRLDRLALADSGPVTLALARQALAGEDA